MLLGVMFASDRWNYTSRRLAKLQDQRSKLEQELRELRQKQDWATDVPSAGQGAGDLIVEDQDLVPPKNGGAAAVILESDTGNVDHRAVIEKYFSNESVEVDPDFGILYTSVPNVIDPLRLVRGVGPRVEYSLNELGVFRFKQIANWSDGNVAAFARSLPQGHVNIKRDKWPRQSHSLWQMVAGSAEPAEEVDYESKILSEFRGEAVTADPNLGVVYTGIMTVPDSLQRIEGIDAVMAEALGNLGIHRFAQVSTWSRRSMEQIAGRLSISPQQIVDQRWIPQSRLLEWERQTASPEWGTTKPTMTDYAAKASRDYEGEPLGLSISMGIIYKTAPAIVDDLTEIFGIDQSTAQKLNGEGVWKYQQIADWSDANVKAFASRLGVTRDMILGQRWIPQAERFAATARKRAAFAGESFRTDPKLGIVYYMEPPNADDLSRIKGMTPELAAVLNREGVFTYKQIALWEPSNLEVFAGRAGVDLGGILRDGWIHQSQQLHLEKYGVEMKG
tara:strand:- start:11072 stop:12583 length:1512 start_codon:yes stop_codon:yes gene_type:complete